MKERGKTRKTLAGQLLLAHPTLRDENFRRAVILMSAHDADGAMGVVLNRPLGRPLGEVSPDFALTPLAELPVYRGGPVETGKLILVSWQMNEQAGELQLNFGLEPERAFELFRTPGVTLRAFMGYSGWGKGQLENELRHNTWFTAPLELYNLGAADGPALWRMVLGSLDPELKLFADEPEDPSRN
ncbi:MAG: YqgE/AlgH family protein [Opitutae bacterium]|nr:YqgE/AlgH family protein [Opitutae bacterium]